jgi:hypothetical protein
MYAGRGKALPIGVMVTTFCPHLPSPLGATVYTQVGVSFEIRVLPPLIPPYQGYGVHTSPSKLLRERIVEGRR